MLTGSIVAIATPMHPDGSLDLDGFRKLIDFHVDEGTAGIVVAGTTGESSTVSVADHELLIRSAVEHAGSRVPIIAGTGANSTAEAIELAAYARKVGARYSLSVVPYYNKPTQEGLYQHFRKIAESVDLPLILYNVPGRTVADLANDTVLRLAQVPGIVGLKDATGDIGRGSDLLRRLPTNFAVYSGDDATALALMLMGAQGVISVTANVAPKLMQAMCMAALEGDVERARSINRRLLPLHHKLFVEANPIPVKWALAEMGLIPRGIRLPLTPLSAAHHDTVRAALREAGLLA
ncbi:4-hydroxy-tetrahydrodipicolinate synthase [Burkholderiales bacterium]|nr:MAG: 4-hydroxy-tetrahydrodipicolinate synthase [Burkholderiales bacterium]CAG0985690.1 4-hydroxy-tetrahydrodipicolinate synthase [Burkholderiales bacterium]